MRMKLDVLYLSLYPLFEQLQDEVYKPNYFAVIFWLVFTLGSCILYFLLRTKQ